MPLINLKFSPEMEELILQGKKCCTTRLDVKGIDGSHFIVGNRLYRIITVISERYNSAFLERYYRIEGFDTAYKFEDVLNGIYTNIESGDEMICHYFAYIGELCSDCVTLLTMDD